MVFSDEDTLSFPQPSPPPFSFSHPLVYAARVQDRVHALDAFIRRDLAPKVFRLREDHDCIEHQLQRTMTKQQNDAYTKRQTPKQKQAQRLKHRAWLWKRSSKQQELNRFGPFLQLATDLRTLSSDLNPKILLLSVLWQRSQSIAPLQHIAADDRDDVVYNDEIMNQHKNIRRYREHQRLSREYHDAFLENIRISKSIQTCMNKLLTSEYENANANSTEDASAVSSLKIFSNKHCICSSCQAMFHNDYLGALFISVPENIENDSCSAKSKSAFLCIHCWNSTALGYRQTKDFRSQSCESGPAKIVPLSSKSTDITKNRENKIQTAANIQKKNYLFETTRFKTRVKVIKKRMTEAVASRNGDSSPDSKTDDTHNAEANEMGDTKDNSAASSSAFEHCIGSITSLEDGLSIINDSFSSCSILGEYNQEDSCPTFHPLSSLPLSFDSESCPTGGIGTIRLKVNSSAVVNNNGNNQVDATRSNENWAQFGSSSSSICSNSIVESEHESIQSNQPSTSNPIRYVMVDRRPITTIRNRKSERRTRYVSPDRSVCGNSMFSESPAEKSKFPSVSPTTYSHVRPKYIKSAMKKSHDSSSSSRNGTSPTKVNEFPFYPSNTKKNVRFRSPLQECRLYNPMSAIDSNKVLIDSSAEIMDQIEYFCKWDDFMNPFERMPENAVS